MVSGHESYQGNLKTFLRAHDGMVTPRSNASSHTQEMGCTQKAMEACLICYLGLLN